MKTTAKLVNQNLLREKLANSFLIQKGQNNPLLLITISREMGAGGKPIAQRVAKKLGKKWQVYHKEIVDEMAKAAKLEKKLISQTDENQISAIEEFLGGFFGNRYLSLNAYQRHLTKILTPSPKKATPLLSAGARNISFRAL